MSVLHTNYRILLVCANLLVILFSTNICHAAVKNTESGMLDFNFYPWLKDVDSDSVFTINAASTLHNGWSYFSLTNFYNQSDSPEFKDTANYYTEQNIRKKIGASSLDITGQFNFRSGNDNDRHRLGFRWRLNNSKYLETLFNNLNLTWSINFHVLQFDHTDANDWQIEHSFSVKFPWLSERLYLAGFIDHTFGEDLSDDYPSDPVVAEVQIGYNLVENLYVITEYRINEYRLQNENNLAAGIQYKFLW